MRIPAALLTAVLSMLPFGAEAQDAKATLEAAAKALGDATSLEIQGSGVMFQVGQSYTPGQPWPQFNVRTFNRVVNYETASLREPLRAGRVILARRPSATNRTLMISSGSSAAWCA